MAFSTRRGGVSLPPYDSLNLGRSTPDRPEAVEENRRHLLQSLGLKPRGLATVGQVHGAEVALADAPGFHPGCDAIVTRTPGLVLAVSAADCLPILCSAGATIAAAHAGWRGTEAGIPESTVRAVCEKAGLGPTRVHVHFGPCIRNCCYEVGPEVAARFPVETVTARGGSLYLDLPAAARLRLLAAGVAPEAIEDTGACTGCEPFWYFSHRRDRGATGRLWGVIGLLDRGV